MADQDALLAVSSPAEPSTEAVPGLPDIDSFTAEERSEWQKRGTPFKSPTAESTPAPKPAPVEKPVESAVDSGATSTQGKTKGADARIQELLADRHELRTRLESLEKAQKPADTPAATETKPETKGKPVKPDFAKYTEEGKSFADYKADLDKYEEAREAWLLAEAERTVEGKLTARQQQETAAREIAEAEKTHGEGFAGARKRIAENSPEALQVAISGLKNWAAIVNHLGKEENAEVLKELGELVAISRDETLARLGEISAELKASAPKEAPVKQQTTKAPRPITDISGRQSAPIDPIKAAVENDDFDEYRRLANERDLAARRKRA